MTAFFVIAQIITRSARVLAAFQICKFFFATHTAELIQRVFIITISIIVSSNLSASSGGHRDDW
jgi:hypothetical protein